MLEDLCSIFLTKTTVEMRSGWWGKSGNTVNWFFWKNTTEPQSRGMCSRCFTILNEQRITLYAFIVQVSAWNPQSSWIFNMEHMTFHCYVGAFLSCHCPKVGILARIGGGCKHWHNVKYESWAKQYAVKKKSTQHYTRQKRCVTKLYFPLEYFQPSSNVS